jgi:hypothetical protein
MKNIITEELGYMKYLLGYQRGVVISEQEIGEAPKNPPISKKEKNVQAAYQLMIDGAENWGTDPQKIVNAINMIKSEDELDRLFTLFKDKKTGYSDFSEMIRGEFESNNQKDLDKIVSKLNTWYDLKKETPEKFSKLTFTPITKPLTDAAPPSAAPAAEPALPESENKEHWEDVVKYYEGNKDPNWKFEKKNKDQYGGKMLEYVSVDSTDTNDSDSQMDFWDDGEVYIYNKGKRKGTSKGTWEWDGTKPVIKFKDISKNASGYVQPTDTDWSAVTEDNKVIGLNAKGPLVKEVQQKLIIFGYSGTTSGSITTDIEACEGDVEKCDGVYGPTTKEMVKQYQKDNGLSVDGIVGQQTYNSMF